MMTKKFISFTLGSVALSGVCSAGSVVSGRQALDQRPNILWITYEDTSPQFLAPYGCNVTTTPIMDRYGLSGVIFNNAYSTAPVSSASRSTLITGCSTEAMGTGNHRSSYSLPEMIKGFPYFLRQAGYYTSNNVKTDYNVADEAAFIKEAWNDCSDQAGWWNRAESQPFFAVFNFEDSHQSRTMTRPYRWYEEEVFNTLPDSSKVFENDVELPLFYRDSPEMRRSFVRVHNSLRKTDIEVGKLLERLKQDGLLENTIIFIFADHGEGIPRAKCHSIALGHRVPFYLWFPQKWQHLSPWGAGVKTEELVSFIDLAPTVLSIAEVDMPNYFTGRAIMGKARVEAPNYVFGARNRLDESPGLERTIFDGRWVYSRNFYPRLPVIRYQKYAEVSDIVKLIRSDAKDALLNSLQYELVEVPRAAEYLYDLKNDPWELNNLSTDPRYIGELERMRKACFEHIVAVRDIHFLPEGLMVERTQGTSAYQMRLDPTLNPIEEMLEVAQLVGIEKNADVFLKYLKSDQPELRYWAAVGLNHLPAGALPKLNVLKRFIDDSSIYVRIEIAALLYKHSRDPKAKQLLESAITGSNMFAAHQAIQQVIYLSDCAADFVKVVSDVAARYSTQDASGIEFNVQSSAQTFLYIHDNQPLIYAVDKQWYP